MRRARLRPAPSRRSYHATVLADDPVAYYPLDSALDGSTIPALVGPECILQSGGPVVPFDGPSSRLPGGWEVDGNDYGRTSADPIFPVAGSLSVEVWCRWTTTAATKVPLCLRVPGGDLTEEAAILCNRDTAGDVCLFRGGGNLIVAGSGLNDGRWHHLLGVVDEVADTSALYIDGELAGTGGRRGVNGGDRVCAVGTNPGASGQGFIGGMIAAAVYDRAVGDDVAIRHYAAAF